MMMIIIICQRLVDQSFTPNTSASTASINNHILGITWFEDVGMLDR